MPGVRSWRLACTTAGAHTASRMQIPKRAVVFLYRAIASKVALQYLQGGKLCRQHTRRPQRDQSVTTKTHLDLAFAVLGQVLAGAGTASLVVPSIKFGQIHQRHVSTEGLGQAERIRVCLDSSSVATSVTAKILCSFTRSSSISSLQYCAMYEQPSSIFMPPTRRRQ